MIIDNTKYKEFRTRIIEITYDEWRSILQSNKDYIVSGIWNGGNRATFVIRQIEKR